MLVAEPNELSLIHMVEGENCHPLASVRELRHTWVHTHAHIHKEPHMHTHINEGYWRRHPDVCTFGGEIYGQCKGPGAGTNLAHVSHRDKSRAAELWSVRREEELPMA